VSRANDILEAFADIDFDFEEVDDGRLCNSIKRIDYPKQHIIKAIEVYLETTVDKFKWTDDISFFEEFPNRRQRFIYDKSTENNCHGYIEITGWHPYGVRIEFNELSVVLLPFFKYNYDVYAIRNPSDSKNESHLHFSNGAAVFGGHQHLEVPINLIWYWINGKNEGQREFFLKGSDNKYLHYASGSYPIVLKRYFASKGLAAFDKLYQEGAMTPETYELIKSKLSPFFKAYKERQAMLAAARSEESAKKENSPQNLAPNYAEELVALSLKDRERLLKIHRSNHAHTSRGWMEYLGFDSTGGSEPFIVKMKALGFVTAETDPKKGRRLRLTDKGLKVLKVLKTP